MVYPARAIALREDYPAAAPAANVSLEHHTPPTRSRRRGGPARGWSAAIGGVVDGRPGVGPSGNRLRRGIRAAAWG